MKIDTKEQQNEVQDDDGWEARLKEKRKEGRMKIPQPWQSFFWDSGFTDRLLVHDDDDAQDLLLRCLSYIMQVDLISRLVLHSRFFFPLITIYFSSVLLLLYNRSSSLFTLTFSLLIGSSLGWGAMLVRVSSLFPSRLERKCFVERHLYLFWTNFNQTSTPLDFVQFSLFSGTF